MSIRPARPATIRSARPSIDRRRPRGATRLGPAGAAGPLAARWSDRVQLVVGSATSDKLRDIHALWFNILLGLIVLHVLAIIFYRWRGKHLTKPMITGRAALDPGAQPMRPGKWWAALICLAVSIGMVRWI